MQMSSESGSYNFMSEHKIVTSPGDDFEDY
jgi:hypothetical protein